MCITNHPEVSVWTLDYRRAQVGLLAWSQYCCTVTQANNVWEVRLNEKLQRLFIKKSTELQLLLWLKKTSMWSHFFVIGLKKGHFSFKRRWRGLSIQSRKRHFESQAHIDDLCIFRAFPAQSCKNSQVKSLSWGWCWMKGHRLVKWIKTLPLDTINMYNTFHWKQASNIRKMRDRLYWFPAKNNVSQQQGNWMRLKNKKDSF